MSSITTTVQTDLPTATPPNAKLSQVSSANKAFFAALSSALETSGQSGIRFGGLNIAIQRSEIPEFLRSQDANAQPLKTRSDDADHQDEVGESGKDNTDAKSDDDPSKVNGTAAGYASHLHPIPQGPASGPAQRLGAASSGTTPGATINAPQLAQSQSSDKHGGLSPNAADGSGHSAGIKNEGGQFIGDATKLFGQSNSNQQSFSFGQNTASSQQGPENQFLAQPGGQSPTDNAVFSQLLNQSTNSQTPSGQSAPTAPHSAGSQSEKPISSAQLAQLSAKGGQGKATVPVSDAANGQSTASTQGGSAFADLASKAGGPAKSPTQAGTPAKGAEATTQVSLAVRKGALDGKTRFTIRLDPPELGKVEVKLDFLKDGAIRAVVKADNPETLDLLQRDARQLERALQDAGLKPGSDSLNFSLNQNGSDQRQSAFSQFANGEEKGGLQADEASDQADEQRDRAQDSSDENHILDIADGLDLVI